MRATFTALARRRTLAAIVLAITAFAATRGVAATLGLGANALAAGSAPIASCQAAGAPTGTYAVAFDPALAAYAVSTVTVTNLDASCAGKTISLTLTAAGSGGLGTVAGTVPAGGGSLTLTPGATVAAADVTGVSVAIVG